MKIGLFGGSFDPAHTGHAHVAQTALRALKLDRVWWLPAADHPFKPNQTPFAARLACVRALVLGPKQVVSTLERDLHNQRSIETVTALQARAPGVHFVWVMGADSFVELNRWKHWKALTQKISFCVIARPGASRAALSSPAARFLARYRVPWSKRHNVPFMDPPAWVYLPAPLHAIASRDLR